MKTAQPVDGAIPPAVFSRWMKVVGVSLSPPVGPSLVSNHLQQEPGNRARRDEGGVGGVVGVATAQTVLVSRECCHVARGQAILIRVGAEEVGDDLLHVVVEQGGLRPEECPGEAGAPEGRQM